MLWRLFRHAVNGDLGVRHASGERVTVEGLQGSSTEHGWGLGLT